MTAFFDTNLLVYAQSSGEKAEIARELLAAGGQLSVQVLNEFASVLSRKQGRSWGEIDEAIEDVLAAVNEPIPLTLEIHREARGIAASSRFAFYDALIIAAALSARCSVLYSEDLQRGRRFGDLTIINPFAIAR